MHDVCDATSFEDDSFKSTSSLCDGTFLRICRQLLTQELKAHPPTRWAKRILYLIMMITLGVNFGE